MNTYFERYAYPGKLFNKGPNNKLKLSIVIPCYNEPDIISSLISLNSCTPVEGTEVIIIVNESERCKPDISQQNKKTLAEIDSWQSSTKLNFNLLVHYLIAPHKNAGVGFARKVGMDEAARRFELVNNKAGVICCFDADSTCSRNYLTSVYKHFYQAQTPPNAASIYFEHPFPTTDDTHANGIIQYELHLRYYVQALKYLGYPYAHHTIGSSMVVRSDIYQKVGGMNKRKAGEDFYFLHRVMPTGYFIDIQDTVIYPSARISDRVPFGTGKAMAKWHETSSQNYFTYNLQSFIDLKIFFNMIGEFYTSVDKDLAMVMESLPKSVAAYLKQLSFITELRRLKNQSTSLSTFTKNWYHYFDGFRVLKYLHASRDNFYSDSPVISEAKKLAALSWNYSTNNNSAKDWLLFYRQQDREN